MADLTNLIRYRQEYEICKRLDISSAIQVYALELTQDAQTLTLTTTSLVGVTRYELLTAKLPSAPLKTSPYGQ